MSILASQLTCLHSGILYVIVSCSACTAAALDSEKPCKAIASAMPLSLPIWQH